MPLTVGTEFPVNDPVLGDKDFSTHSMAILPDGRIVVVWTGFGPAGDGDPTDGGTGVRARILNADGTPAGDEFVVNSTTLNAQDGASVAVLSDGRIVFAWRSNEDGDGGTVSSDPCVRARVFNADGTPATYNGSSNDFVVNMFPGYFQDTPVVGALTDGAFVIAFRSQPVEDFFGDWQAMARMFSATAPVGSEFSLNQSASVEYLQSLTVLEDGKFVAAWQDVFLNSGDVVARVFNANGTPFSNDFGLATTNVGSQHQVHVGSLSGNRFAAVWSTDNSGGSVGADDGSSTGLCARVFNADGTADLTINGGNDFIVNTTTLHDQRRANVVGLDDGRFLISFWSRTDPSGNTENNILGRLFNANGTPDGNDFVIKEGLPTAFGSTSGQPNDVVRALDGRILALYDNQPNDDLVQGNFLDGRTSGVTFNGDANANQYVGTAFVDTLNGNGGNDRLSGGADNDTFNGGAGNDTLTGGAGADRFILGVGGQVDTLTDFAAGAGTGETIDLTAFDVIRSFNDIMARATQVGTDTVIILPAGDALILQNVVRETPGRCQFQLHGASRD